MGLARRVLVAGLLAGAVAGVAAEEAATALEVGGGVATPLSLTVDALRSSPPDSIATASYRRGDGRAAPSTVRGVRLAALVERAQPRFADPHAWKRTVVVATARDGYRVVFSWPELVNAEVGGGALVVFERDGLPLDASEGPFALVSTRDLRTGPRSVKWLRRLDVRSIDD